MNLVKDLLISVLWVAGIAVSFYLGTVYGIGYIIITGVIAIRRLYA